jgi:ubiquinone biosynthesis protein
MKSAIHLLRIMCITGTLLRHNSLFVLLDLKLCPRVLKWPANVFSIVPSKYSKGERIRSVLENLGPFFIKFGQTIATRGDLIGQEIAKDLSGLQDSMEPVLKKEDAVGLLEREFGQDINSLFKKISDSPVAAASVAEVFKAEMLSGEKVAVKFLKPGIKEEFKKDIDLFLWGAKILDKRFKRFKRLRLVEVVRSFESSMESEMDLTLEAAAASELHDNHTDDLGVQIPKVFWNTTSHSIITIEWIEGVPINNVEKLKKKKINMGKVIKNLTYLFLNEAYRDGFFHADLHPGNVLVKDNGDIALIDFGIMGRLDKKTKLYLSAILKGFLTRDYDYVAKVHLRAGYVDSIYSEGEFSQACRAIGEPIVGVASGRISIGRLLSSLFKVTRDFNMPVQPQLILVQKTTVVLEGLVSQLDKNANVWEVAEPWVEKWSQKNTGFDATVMDSFEEIVDFVKSDLMQFIKNQNKEKQEIKDKKSNYSGFMKIAFGTALLYGAIFLIQQIL